MTFVILAAGLAGGLVFGWFAGRLFDRFLGGRRRLGLPLACVAAYLALAGGSLWRQQVRLAPVSYQAYDSAGQLLVEAARPSTSVVLISVDTLAARHLRLHGYPRVTTPAIDWLASESVVFENAFSPSPTTAPSHMTMFTSLHPMSHGIRNYTGGERQFVLDHRTITLAEILRAQGYETAAFTAGGNIHGALGFGDGFDLYDNADTDWRRALRWLETVDSPRFFLFLHTYAVHDPYLPPESDDPREATARVPGTEAELLRRCRQQGGCAGAERPNLGKLFWSFVDEEQPDPETIARLVDLYDAGVEWADANRLAPALRLLRERDLLEGSVVVLTSDHGEEFHQHGRFRHSQLYDEVLHVPLLVRFPSRSGLRGRVETQVRLLDLMPTVLEYLGLPIPAAAQGRSLLPALAAGGTDLPVFGHAPVAGPLEAQTLSVCVDRRWKLAWNPSKGREELYDLEVDHDESMNVAERYPAVVEDLRRRLIAWREAARATGSTGGSGEVEVDDATLERLQARGYLE